MGYTKVQMLLTEAEQMAITADENVSNGDSDYGKSELWKLVEKIRAAQDALHQARKV